MTIRSDAAIRLLAYAVLLAVVVVVVGDVVARGWGR
jgi:hypothetical protein